MRVIARLKDKMFYFFAVSLMFFFYSALILFEQSHCIDRIIFCYIWSLTKTVSENTPTPPKKKLKKPQNNCQIIEKEQKQGRSYCFGLCEVRAYKHKCCDCFLPSLET
jgi:hypothetical protein